MFPSGGEESLFSCSGGEQLKMTTDKSQTDNVIVGNGVDKEKCSPELNSLNTPDIIGFMEPTIDLDTFMRQNPFFMDGFNISPSILGQAFTQQHCSNDLHNNNVNLNCNQPTTAQDQLQPRNDTYMTSGQQQTTSYPGFYQQQQDYVNNNNPNSMSNDHQRTVMDISYARKVKEEPIDISLPQQVTANHLRPDSNTPFHSVPTVDPISPPGTPQSSDSFGSGRPYSNGSGRGKKAHADKNSKEYQMKRAKNNIAVRKSREKAKSKQQLTELRIANLEAEVERLRQENGRLKTLMQQRC